MPGGRKRPAGSAHAEPDQLAEQGMVVLHRTSFIEWQPTPVVSLASSADGSLAVAARENGDLELYETSTSHCLQRIPGSKGASTTCVALVDEDSGARCRLFTSGLDGSITEVDLDHRRPASATDSYGGAVWQLALEPRTAAQPAPAVDEHAAGQAAEPVPQPESMPAAAASSDDDDDAGGAPAAAAPRLAAACDDGCVRLFSIEPGVPGASYSKSLPRVEGRVLAVAWHPTARCLVSGGTDGCIHSWDVATGQELLRITAGDASGKPLCVWALAVLPDGTVVSGDSGGSVCFWDARFGTLLARFTQHRADVLQLAVSPDGATVFAAGVDPQVAVFKRVSGLGGAAAQQEWVFLSAKRPHTHDVRAMCAVHGRHGGEGALWTGGNDTVLMTHPLERFLKEHPTKVDACPQRPLLQATCPAAAADAGAARPRLLSAQGATVDLWQLGAAPAAGAGAEGERLPTAESPLHLARLVNRSGQFVMAAALSSDGSRLAYSDAHSVRCFAVAQRAGDEDGDASLALTPVALPAELPPAAYLAFQPGSNALVCIATDGIVRLVTPPGADGGDDADTDAAAPAVVVIRELHDLRYKMWYKRDRARSAARRAAPAVDLAALSPDGRWLAASVHGRMQLLGLDSHRLVAQLPPAAEHSPLAALAFTGDGAAVVAVAACNRVAAYDVPGGQPTEWTRRHAAALPRRLLDLPGPVAGVAASPAGPAAVLLFSPQAVCHVDLSKAPGQEAAGGRKRRARGAAAATPPGLNCRALYCADPVLHVQQVGGAEVLVVERPWAEVWRGLPPPLYRHRYGT